MNVLLFDIDGTLISSGGAGGNALRGAFCHEFDIDEPTQVPFSGRTDRGIARNLFVNHEIEDTQENWFRLRDSYLERLPVELERCEGRVLEGVVELLNHLTEHPAAMLGLLTGNTAAGAKAKLEYYNVFHYFSFGGYGDRHPHRNEVAREALVAAHTELGSHVPGDRVWVVGDTPLDVECGRAIGAKVVAVATGIHERSELEASRPDLMLDSLAELDADVLFG